MDLKETVERGNGLRTRSFRYEDYNNRRVFLRSYPLQWGGGDEQEEEEVRNEGKEEEESNKKVTNKENNGKKKLIQKMMVSVIHWGGGKVLILRRFKNKLTIYFIACVSLGFKPPTGVICFKDKQR